MTDLSKLFPEPASWGNDCPVQNMIRDEGLHLHFQPIVDSETGIPRWYECLARIKGENGELVPPAQWLPDAVKTGSIRNIDYIVLMMALEELAAYPRLSLAVNVSNVTVADPHWFEVLWMTTEKRPGIGRRLMVEITEQAPPESWDKLQTFVQDVRKAGCVVALDDFGAGYASVEYALRLTGLGIVKIDGGLVKNIARREADLIAVEALKKIADGRGLTTIAEWIETPDVARIVTMMGIQYQQGYLYGKPSAERPWRAAERLAGGA